MKSQNMRTLALMTLLLPLALLAVDTVSQNDDTAASPVFQGGNASAPDGVRPGGTLVEHFEAPAIAGQDTRLPRNGPSSRR